MSLTLSGKRVLVTGSTDGLGKQTALALAKQGAHIIIHGRNEKRVKETLDEFKTLSPSTFYEHIVCDLENSDEIIVQFSKIKKLDILINNAGVWLEGNTINATPDRIKSLVAVNTLAPLLITNLLLPKLMESEYGQILNIVSKDGAQIPHGYFDTIYVATKYALQGFTESLALEMNNKHIRVMGYYPGGMETHIFKKAGDNLKEHEPWMFPVSESVDAIVFMLTRNTKVNLKRMDLINQLEG